MVSNTSRHLQGIGWIAVEASKTKTLVTTGLSTYCGGTHGEAKKLDEIDLRPYQTHFLFKSNAAITPKKSDDFLDELKSIVDGSLFEHDERCEIIEEAAARRIGKNETLGWFSGRLVVRTRHGS